MKRFLNWLSNFLKYKKMVYTPTEVVSLTSIIEKMFNVSRVWNTLSVICSNSTNTKLYYDINFNNDKSVKICIEYIGNNVELYLLGVSGIIHIHEISNVFQHSSLYFNIFREDIKKHFELLINSVE